MGYKIRFPPPVNPSYLHNELFNNLFSSSHKYHRVNLEIIENFQVHSLQHFIIRSWMLGTRHAKVIQHLCLRLPIETRSFLLLTGCTLPKELLINFAEKNQKGLNLVTLHGDSGISTVPLKNEIWTWGIFSFYVNSDRDMNIQNINAFISFIILPSQEVHPYSWLLPSSSANPSWKDKDNTVRCNLFVSQ